MARIARSLLALVALLVLGAAAPAGGTENEAAQQEALARLTENYASYESAQLRLAELEAQYARARHSHELIGVERAKLVENMLDAKRQMAAAREAHPELFEAARRRGVPWNVLDPYETLPGEADAPASADPDTAN